VKFLNIVNHSLLSLNILEHELLLWDSNVIGKHFRVFFIKFKNLGKSLVAFLGSVRPLKELGHVVKDEVVFEDRHYMGVLIIDDIRDYLRVVIFSRGKILLFKIFSEDVFNEQIRAEFAVSNRHVQDLKYLSVSL